MKSFAVSALVGLAIAGPVNVVHVPTAGVVAPQDGDLGPFSFTSTYNLVATPDRVVNADSAPAPGEAGAMGYYHYGINSALDTICYNITLVGVTGPYDSPAVTATHIHQAAEGRAGPPRIAFPNPEPADSGPEVVKRSSGCITGPFQTGITDDDGVDTGAGFTLAQIEADPASFFTDSHTVVSVAGVVRAQMQANAPAAVQQSNRPGCSTQIITVGPPVTILCLP